MNVTIDSMQSTSAGRALWWFSLACVVCGGLVMRLLTIDRNTPGIGAFVYFGLFVAMFLLIALPLGAGGAALWHASSRYRVLAWLKRIGSDARAQWWLVAIAVIASLLFASAGRRLPQWHVWMSAALWNALIVWRLFDVMLRELRMESQRETRRE